MSYRRGPRHDEFQGKRGLLDPWEGAPGNQQSPALSQAVLMAEIMKSNINKTVADNLLASLNLLGGRPQVQSLLTLNAPQRTGQLGGEMQHRFYAEVMQRPQHFDRKKRTGPFHNRGSRPGSKYAEKKGNSSNKKEDAGAGSHHNNKRDDDKSKTRKFQDAEDSDDQDGGPYSGISSDHFYCHVCEKRMWDDTSFFNHIKGRAHHGLMELRNESYKIQVDLMRHEMQLAEELRKIEMDRNRRRGKNVRSMPNKEYCTMCDLHFFGNIVAHRKQEFHQALKKFLHPCCVPCGKEFHTRIEWDEHNLSPDHMKKCPEGAGNLKIDPTIGLDDFELDEKVKEEILAESGEDGSSLNIRRLVPKYIPDAGFALKMVVPATGFECALCKSFFNDEETIAIHCRTKTHFDNYITYEKRKARIARERMPPPKPKLHDLNTKEPVLENKGTAEKSKETSENLDVSSELDDSFNRTLDSSTQDTLILNTDESLSITADEESEKEKD